MLEVTARESREFSALVKRNRAVAPYALFVLSGLAACVALGIALGWAVAGAWMVVPFAGLESVALLAAVWVFSRHAGDFELISLDGDRLLVEIGIAGTVARFEFNAAWVRIVALEGQRDRVAVRYGGRDVEIGRHLLEGERRWLVRELTRRLPWARS